MTKYWLVTASYFALGSYNSRVALYDSESGGLTVISRPRQLQFSEQKLFLVPVDGAEDYLGLQSIPADIKFVVANQLWPDGIPLELRSPYFFDRLIDSGDPCR